MGEKLNIWVIAGDVNDGGRGVLLGNIYNMLLCYASPDTRRSREDSHMTTRQLQMHHLKAYVAQKGIKTRFTITILLVLVVIPFILDVRFVDAPAGVTQEEGHTGFLHLPSAVLALIFIAIRIQPSLSLVDREVEFCVITN